jgi:hypothetical protein
VPHQDDEVEVVEELEGLPDAGAVGEGEDSALEASAE